MNYFKIVWSQLIQRINYEQNKRNRKERKNQNDIELKQNI